MNPEKKKKIQFSTQIWSKLKLFSTFILIRNVSWAANQHLGVISEGSCDTEDWSNDAENSALQHRNKLHFKCIQSYFKMIQYFAYYYGFLLYFYCK